MRASPMPARVRFNLAQNARRGLSLRAHGTAAKLGFKNAEWITAIEG
jgi:hypothetical protein